LKLSNSALHIISNRMLGGSDHVKISKEGFHQILSQMVRLGYFHHGNAPDNDQRNSSDDDDKDDLEAFREWQSGNENRRKHSWDGHCQICRVNGNGDFFYSRQGLVQELTQRLEGAPYHGRGCLQALCRDLGVDCETIFLSTYSKQQASSASEGSAMHSVWDFLPKSMTILQQGGDMELLSADFWERTKREIASQVEEQGSCKIIELSSVLNLPLEVLMEHVVSASNLPPSVCFLEDSKMLVSSEHLQTLQKEALTYFHGLEEPIQIGAVCHERGWELEQVLDWLQKNQEGHGEVHVDDNTYHHQSAMYMPLSYQRQQEQAVMDFLTTNGFVTLDRAPNRHTLKTLVEDSFPDAFVIGQYDVVIMDAILEEVRAGVSDYVASSSSEILDLQDYLPAELVRPQIVSNVLSKIGFDESQGVSVSTSDYAVVVRKNLIDQMEERHLSQLVQDFSKSKADEIFRAKNHGVEEAIDDHPGGKKETKVKSKRGRGGKQIKVSQGDRDLIVPLVSVAEAILDAYPTFQSGGSIPESIEWEDASDDGEGTDNLVVDFCRKVFFTPAFQKKCERAVGAELKRLESEKNSKATLSRKDAAAKVRSIEAAFEDAFVTLCYLIQAQAKFITFASSLEFFDEDATEILKNEFLEGPCADLTSRVTQQCLFKEEQDALFTFSHPDCPKDQKNVEEKRMGLPEYCSSVDTACRRYPQTFLSCPPPRDPLPVLRESFSGNIGIALSRQWILCGGECYKGGIIKVADDGEGDQSEEVLHVRRGNVDGFVSHVEENSLTLCGLPFKKLDKKSEKNFLFSRKQQLLALLSAATDPTIILEYTIMILFQHVRQLVVSGSLLRGPILSALSGERKIPEPVASALQELNAAIESGGTAASDETLLTLIKECGMCKDISKHDTSRLEAHLSSM
jgi:E3 UFM1-protein ligase 1